MYGLGGLNWVAIRSLSNLQTSAWTTVHMSYSRPVLPNEAQRPQHPTLDCPHLRTLSVMVHNNRAISIDKRAPVDISTYQHNHRILLHHLFTLQPNLSTTSRQPFSPPSTTHTSLPLTVNLQLLLWSDVGRVTGVRAVSLQGEGWTESEQVGRGRLQRQGMTPQRDGYRSDGTNSWPVSQGQ